MKITDHQRGRMARPGGNGSAHAVSVAALTVYDMVKAVERTARISNIRLIEKHGGRSGDVINE